MDQIPRKGIDNGDVPGVAATAATRIEGVCTRGPTARRLGDRVSRERTSGR